MHVVLQVSYNKSYASAEEERLRMKVYLAAARAVARHNRLYRSGRATYSQRLGRYSDLLREEQVRMLNGFNNTKTE